MHEIGALLDARAVHGGRSARNHLLSLAQTNGIPRRRVGEVLGIVGLSDVAGKRSKGFSLGMSQRPGIAAALLGDPGILMFDEPVNGLDAEGILWIRNLMRSLAAEGRTVLLSSHLMSEMENTAAPRSFSAASSAPRTSRTRPGCVWPSARRLDRRSIPPPRRDARPSPSRAATTGPGMR